MTGRPGGPLRWLWMLAALLALVASGSAAARQDVSSSTSAVGTGAATSLEMIGTDATASELTVTLHGNGSLQASSIHEADEWPPRVVVDLPNLRQDAPSVLPVGIGPVRQVRVAPHSQTPPVTRVVFDLTQPARYRVATEEGSETISLVFPLDAVASHVDASPLDPESGTVSEDRDGGAEPPPTLASAAAASAAHVLIDPFAALQLVKDEPRPGQEAAEMLLAGTEQPAATVSPDPAAAVEALAEPGVDAAGDAAGSAETDVAAAPAEPPAVEAEPSPAATLRAVGASTPRYPVMTELRAGSGQPPAQPPQGRAAAQIQQQIAPGAGRQYTGHPITMDFQNADLRSVLRTFAEISGLNIVIDPTVQGTVDVALTEVPWDQALDIILRANRLGYVVDGTVVRIAPLTTLADEEAQRRKLAEEQALSGELVVRTFQLSYSRAADIQQLITQSALSSRGQVNIDERTNMLIMRDLQANLETAQQLIGGLDIPERQVEIEARIVQANQNYAKALGIQWGVTGRMAQDLSNTAPLAFPNRVGVSGRVGGTQGPQVDGVDARSLATEDAGTAVNLPVAGATSALGLSLGSVNGSLNLDIILSALENEGKARILSNPRVTTQNNVQAEIVQGDQIPIQTVANNTVTVTFQDAALTLLVTPQITAAGTVIMQVELENDFADFGREVNGIPPIVTQRARTTVQVADGDTTVIGGIFESTSTTANNRTPLLNRIPLLGWLFKSQSVRETTDELLIFLTPRIVP